MTAQNDPRILNAVALAEHGFGIFPVFGVKDGVCRCPKAEDCHSPGKHPITGDGFKSATTDPERITTFLSNAGHPNYGVVAPPGVFILDVDGPDVARFDRLAGELGPLPPTFTVSTAHGKHIYLRWPDNEPQPDHRMFGLITRWSSGKGQGYVIGPGSTHASGHVYTVLDPSLPAVLPRKWSEAAKSKPVEFVIPGGPEELPHKGGRHEWLRNRARNIAGVIRDPESLFAAVWAENLRLEEPKSEAEVRQAIGDVLEKYGPDPEARYIEAANFQRAGLGYRMADVFNDHSVVLEVQSLHERKGSLYGELTVTVDGDEVSRSDEPMSDAVRAMRLAEALEHLSPIGVYWGSIIEGFYRRVREEVRKESEGSIVRLSSLPDAPAVEYVLDPLVIKGVGTILFAKEGTGKSTVAAAIAVSVASGKAVLDGWTVPEASPVLVLDWETTGHDWATLTRGIVRGAGLPESVLYDIHYDRMTKPMTKDIERLLRAVRTEGIGLVIVDSVMMASPPGQGEAADSALELFRGLRELGTTNLLVDHLNKTTPSGDGARPYGSVYKPALARATYELHAREGSPHEDVEFGVQHLTISHRKGNLTAPLPDLLFQVQRVGNAIRFEPDVLLLTRDAQYQKVVKAIEKYGPATEGLIRKRTNLVGATLHNILKHYPEFTQTAGDWYYDPNKVEEEGLVCEQ